MSQLMSPLPAIRLKPSPVWAYDPSPDVAMFKKMKDIFKNINTGGAFQVFDVKNKDELIELFSNILTKYNINGELFVREDYCERLS